MATFTGVIKLERTWTELKAVATARGIGYSYDEDSSAYEVFCLDQPLCFVSVIYKGPTPIASQQTQNDLDKADWEGSYKATANARISASAGAAGTPSGGVLSVQGVVGGQAVPISGTLTNAQGTGAGAAAPWSVRLSDGTSFYVSPSAAQLPAALVGGRLDTNNGAWLGSTAPTVGQKTMANSLPVAIASDQGALTVSGTVTANIGTSGSLALDATLTGNNQRTRITDGTNLAAVKAASTAAVAGDPSLVVAVSPNTTVAVTQSGSWTNTATQGTAAAATAPWAVRLSDGTAFYVAPAAAQLPAALVGGRLDTNNGAWLGSTAPTVGSKTSANSIPVVIASDQGAIAVTASNPSVGSNNAAIPTSSTQVGGSDGTNLQAARVFDADSGAGTQFVLGAILRKAASGGSVEAGTSTDPLRVDPTGTTTQPVSGTVTANIGTSGSLALDATLTGNNQRTRITDGTSLAAVKAASTAAVVGDPALVVAVSPNNTIAATQSGSWTATVTQATAANLNATVVQGTAAALSGRWPVIVTDGTNSMPTGDVATRGIFHRITDGTNTAAVKAASTAPVAADPALVVAQNPNAPAPMTADRSGTGNIVALNGTVAVNTQGASTVVITASGTWTATLIFEGTLDGSTWFTIPAQTIGLLPSVGSSITANVTVLISCGGFAQTRVRASAFTSGTAVITYDASSGVNPSLFTQISDGSVGPVNVTAPSTAALPTDEALVVAISPNAPDTYSIAVTGLTMAATPTDIFTITGSATRTVRVTRIAMTGTQTTGTQRDVLIIKRSTANTGGTSTSPTPAPFDSTSAAATAVIRAYTVNPSALGTSVGTVRSRKVLLAGATGNSDEMIVEFGTRNSEAVVLRGVAQVLSVNLNSITSTGNSVSVSIEWTEE